MLKGDWMDRKRGHQIVVTALMGVSALLLSSCGSGGLNAGKPVTKAEYWAGIQATVQCIQEKGFDTGEPVEYAGGLYAIPLNSSADADEATEDAMMRAHDSCFRKHAASLENRYIESMALSGEEWEADYRDMIDCLEAAGVSGIKVGDLEGVVGEAVYGNDEAQDCLQAHLFKLFRGINAE